MILISDYDRTLTQIDGRIRETDRQAILTFQNQGHLFGIASGRSVTTIHHLLGQNHLRADVIIGNNGAVIADGCCHEITRFGIDANLADTVNQKLKHACYGYAVCDGKSYAYHGFGRFTFKRNMGLSDLSVDAMVEQKHVVSFVVYFIKHREKTTLIDGLIHNYALIAFPNGFSIDIMAAHVTKANAVAIAARHFKQQDIHVIGDGPNDIPMIQAYHGYAVQRGSATVKSAATHIFTNISDCIRYLTR